MSHSSHRKRSTAPTRLTAQEQLRGSRDPAPRSQRHLGALESTGKVLLPNGADAVPVRGQRDRHRHGQGRPDRPEDRRHAGLDRHAGPFPAPGRSVSRRPGPHPRRRRGADALAKRRDGGSRAAAAVAPRIRRAAHRDHGVEHEHRRAARRPWSSNWANWKKPARSASRRAPAPRRCWRWATPWRWCSARCAISRPRISPASIRAARWAAS